MLGGIITFTLSDSDSIDVSLSEAPYSEHILGGSMELNAQSVIMWTRSILKAEIVRCFLNRLNAPKAAHAFNSHFALRGEYGLQL